MSAVKTKIWNFCGIFSPGKKYSKKIKELRRTKERDAKPDIYNLARYFGEPDKRNKFKGREKGRETPN